MGIFIKKTVKTYGDKVTLDIENICLEKRGYAVLGLNRSSKSTLLNSLANIVPFTKADIIYEDKNLEKKSNYVAINIYISRDCVG